MDIRVLIKPYYFLKGIIYFLPVSKLFILGKILDIQKNFVMQQDLGGPPGTLHELL